MVLDKCILNHQLLIIVTVFLTSIYRMGATGDSKSIGHEAPDIHILSSSSALHPKSGVVQKYSTIFYEYVQFH